MRLPISLLVATAFLVGCSTDDDSTISQTIIVTSNPMSAAVRLNGTPVGRTPTSITLETNCDYVLSVGKGGYAPSVTELKPSLKTDSKGNMSYGFPDRVSVSLDLLPASDDVKVPETDTAEFKRLAAKAKAAEGEKVAEPGSDESKKNSVADLKEDVAAAKQKLAQRETEAAAKVEALKKSLAEAKAPEVVKPDPAKPSEVKVEPAKPDEAKIAALETQISAQEKAAAADRESTANLLKALDSRTDELIRLQREGIDAAKAEATKDIEAQKSIAAKEAEEKAKAEAAKQIAEAQKNAEEQKVAASKEVEERTKAEADKQLTEAQKAAEQQRELAKEEADKQLASVQRIMEEQKTLAAKADEQRRVAELQRMAAELEAKKRAYAEFNSRYALLESRRRNKVITEEEFKEQLSALRKELTK